MVCIRAEKPEQAKAPAASIRPAPRLEAADLWAAYGVTEEDTFVVADKFGNPYFTGKDACLSEKLREVAGHFRAQRKALRKQVAVAQKAFDDGDAAKAVSTLKEGLALGLTGYEEAVSAAELYTKLIEKGREQLKVVDKDLKKLKDLKKTYDGTDLAGEIDSALETASKTSN